MPAERSESCVGCVLSHLAAVDGAIVRFSCERSLPPGSQHEARSSGLGTWDSHPGGTVSTVSFVLGGNRANKEKPTEGAGERGARWEAGSDPPGCSHHSPSSGLT